jgi:hypothetical protein
MLELERYPCPCCGYLVFKYPPGTHEVCPICRWEDDLSQLRFPLMPGSANHVSLVEGQKNFIHRGAAERKNTSLARAPLAEDERDAGWRPVDIDVDNVEEPSSGIDYSSNYPRDKTVLYYWRMTYWRRLSS